eukprot:scaffold63489_cov48-Phaeocystis_antarctica.AAC.1
MQFLLTQSHTEGSRPGVTSSRRALHGRLVLLPFGAHARELAHVALRRLLLLLHSAQHQSHLALHPLHLRLGRRQLYSRRLVRTGLSLPLSRLPPRLLLRHAHPRLHLDPLSPRRRHAVLRALLRDQGEAHLRLGGGLGGFALLCELPLLLSEERLDAVHLRLDEEEHLLLLVQRRLRRLPPLLRTRRATLRRTSRLLELLEGQLQPLDGSLLHRYRFPRLPSRLALGLLSPARCGCLLPSLLRRRQA